jgi:hypothetical protein
MDPTVSGFVPGNRVFGVAKSVDGVAADPQTAINSMIDDVNSIHSIEGAQLKIFHVNGIDDGETIASEMKNVISCAFQPDDASDDIVSVWATPAASSAGARDRVGTTFTFETAASAAQGWLWVLVGS